MQKPRRLLLGTLALVFLTGGIIAGRFWLRDATLKALQKAPQSEISAPAPEAQTPAPLSENIAPTPDLRTPAQDTATPKTSVPTEPQPIEPESVALAEAHLTDWIKAWKAVMPAFDIRTFKKVVQGDIGGYLLPPHTWRLDERRRPLRVYSPDRTRFVDPYGGMGLVEENGKLFTAWDDYSSVTLFDLRTSQALRLAFCGTTCTHDDAIWLSKNLLAVVGTSESCYAADQQCPWVPMLMLFNLSRSTKSIYLGPELPPSQRASYFRTRLKQRLPNINF